MIIDENIEMLSRELLIIRYREIIEYLKYLQVKVNEYEKYYNVETSLRQKTPCVKFFYPTDKVDAIEIIIIPERKFWVYKPYVKTAQEIIEQYLRGEE